MKLKDLFKPKLLEARTKPEDTGEGLVYAIRYEEHPNLSGIFLYKDGKEDILLGERWHTITDFCVQNNWLYDGGCKILENLGFVIDTITGKDIMGRKDNEVYSLCSHNGNLYRGCHNGIFEVSTGKKIAFRFGQVTALRSHKGTLYDGGYCEALSDTFKNEVLNKKFYAYKLCSDKERLYGASTEYKKYHSNGVILDVLMNKPLTKVESVHINALCPYKNKVFYAYNDVIIDISGIEKIHPNKKGVVTAICSIPQELAKQIRYTHDYGFLFGDVQRINPKGFIEYMTNVSDSQERRRIIEQLFNYDNINEEVLKWLNENEQDVMRKAAFY